MHCAFTVINASLGSFEHSIDMEVQVILSYYKREINTQHCILLFLYNQLPPAITIDKQTVYVEWFRMHILLRDTVTLTGACYRI
jgi:hypothetical protein